VISGEDEHLGYYFRSLAMETTWAR
jgi:hypothetical protein